MRVQAVAAKAFAEPAVVVVVVVELVAVAVAEPVANIAPRTAVSSRGAPAEAADRPAAPS